MSDLTPETTTLRVEFVTDNTLTPYDLDEIRGRIASVLHQEYGPDDEDGMPKDRDEEAYTDGFVTIVRIDGDPYDMHGWIIPAHARTEENS